MRYHLWAESPLIATHLLIVLTGVVDRLATSSPDGLIEYFVLTFLRDEFLELRHDFVPPRHQKFHFLFVQIVLGLFGDFVPIQGLEPFKQLSIATYQVTWVFQILEAPKCACKINSPNLPILPNQNISQVG